MRLRSKTYIIISGIIFITALIISLQSADHSTIDKWASFVMGLTSVTFISGLISLFTKGKSFKNQQALS
ncbi:hypothetical protein [Mucilaginibacter lappiensis]|uniref:Uncharacterized protein n=1 Tax=Mucilaginibacter lappiensis TaxID=354630 RepID=A0A1N6T097_9SPHI|nr:hypothetical protein [Mucilaginibacter lappiensis]MBB6108224.1 hypothetical protein [Mucilaginibacter lappiensis]MBB6130366.1 hypothetical protein [Mucilaginibacter lappiensis]SIQ46760.1 hypothetical protein SAMN05421821_102539 [Mucilaginibacter lappiensis]